jgi:chromosome segregation ATPase
MLQSILAVDSLAIQRSLTLLEDRYRELREIGEKHVQAWEAERTDLLQKLSARADDLAATKASHQAELNISKQDNDRLQSELNTIHQDNERLQSDLNDSRQEGDLLVMQLHQVQEELEHHYLKSRELEAQLNEQAEKLKRLRGQRKSLIKLLYRQAEIISRLLYLQSRVTTPAAIAFDRLGGLKWLKKLNDKSQQPKPGQKRLKASLSKKTPEV